MNPSHTREHRSGCIAGPRPLGSGGAPSSPASPGPRLLDGRTRGVWGLRRCVLTRDKVSYSRDTLTWPKGSSGTRALTLYFLSLASTCTVRTSRSGAVLCRSSGAASLGGLPRSIAIGRFDCCCCSLRDAGAWLSDSNCDSLNSMVLMASLIALTGSRCLGLFPVYSSLFCAVQPPPHHTPGLLGPLNWQEPR